MTWQLQRVVLLVVCLCVAGQASAQAVEPDVAVVEDDESPAGDVPTRRVSVRVIEIAGGRAYIEPGTAAGVVRGVRVRLGERNRRVTSKVIGSTASYAIVDVGDARLSEGMRGVAFARVIEGETSKRLPTPTELASFRGQWPALRLPTEDQHPTPVPLGAMGDDRRSHVMLSANGAAIVPLRGHAGTFAQGGMRGRVHVEPWSSAPLSLDADLAVQAYDSRSSVRNGGQGSRPLLYARELSATYGTVGTYALSVGRLRYASEVHGMLDGARARVAFSPAWSAAVFAGAVPNPGDSTPWLSAARFGAELLYRDEESELRPSAVIVAHGSHFDGAIDERRVNAALSINPDGGYANISTELALQDQGNPWNAPQFAAQMLSADVGLRMGDFSFGTAARMQRPERSRLLASLLPAEWLCLPVDPQRTGSDACSGDAYEYRGELRVSHATQRGRLELNGFLGDASYIHAQHWGGQASYRLLRLFDVMRAQVGAGFQAGQLYQSVNARVGLGVSLWSGALDANLYYRPAMSRYRASNDTFVEQGFGAQVTTVLSNAWELLVTGDVVASRDVSVLLVQSQLNYRY